MSLTAVTILTAGRATVIAASTVLVAFSLMRRVRGLSSRTRRLVFGLAAISYFAPTMLAGYGWLPTVVQWPANSLMREVFYGGLMFFRLTPIAALALWVSRAGPTDEARHVARLAGIRRLGWSIREAGGAPWLAAGVVFLLTFQEFDLATSWGMRSWTVALFDAQIGGLALEDSLRMAIAPLLFECAVIFPLVFGLRKKFEASPDRETGRVAGWPVAAVYGIVPVVLFLVVPAVLVFRVGFLGIGAWLESWSMFREVLHGCISGGVAAALAWAVTGIAHRKLKPLLILPGLFGPLLLSLLVLSGTQWTPGFASTVLPWVLTLTLQLLPVAMLLRALLSGGIDSTALHTAQLAAARKVIWTLQHLPSAGAILLLFCLGYSDFTISALLAPPQFTTVFVRVFNLMHYGQSAVLSATVLVAVLVPLLALGLTRLLLGLYVRHCVR